MLNSAFLMVSWTDVGLRSTNMASYALSIKEQLSMIISIGKGPFFGGDDFVCNPYLRDLNVMLNSLMWYLGLINKAFFLFFSPSMKLFEIVTIPAFPFTEAM